MLVALHAQDPLANIFTAPPSSSVCHHNISGPQYLARASSFCYLHANGLLTLGFVATDCRCAGAAVRPAAVVQCFPERWQQRCGCWQQRSRTVCGGLSSRAQEAHTVLKDNWTYRVSVASSWLVPQQTIEAFYGCALHAALLPSYASNFAFSFLKH